MSWYSKTFSTSLGRKLIMSVAGIGLLVYLLVHMGINSLIIFFDSPQTFNVAANFMGSNRAIRVIEIFLFLTFILHIVYGLVVSYRNKMARPIGYKVKKNSSKEPFSDYMTHTALIVLVFLVIHLATFFVRGKITGDVDVIYYDGIPYQDMGGLVVSTFKSSLAYVIFYVVAIIILGFHLLHGMYSAFQTMGLTHKKYIGFIKGASIVYTLIVTLGFIAIPIVIYFFK
jgi:succinate dehydrogenase / fumarate reductase, cytochrome b subunit